MNNIPVFEMKQSFGANLNSEILALEERIKCKLPEDYKAFLMQTNGGEPKKEYFQHRDFGVSIIDFYYGNFPGNYRDIVEATSSFRCMVSGDQLDHVVEIATDPGGLAICIGISNDNFGNVFLFDHDSGKSEINLLKIAESFTEFFNSCYETAEEADAVYDEALKNI